MSDTNNEADAKLSDIRTYRILYRFLRMLWNESRIPASFLGLSTVLVGAVPPIELWLLGQMVDHIEAWLTDNSVGMAVMIWIAIAFIVLLIVRNWLDIVSDLLQDYLRDRLGGTVQRDVLQKSYQLELAFFDKEESYNELQRANEGLETRFVNIYQSLLWIMRMIITVIGLTVVLMSGHWLLGPIVLLVIFPSAWLKVKRARQSYIFDYDSLTPTRRRLAYFRDLQSTRPFAKELRLFQLADHFRHKWQANQLQWTKEILDDEKQELTYGLLNDSIVNLVLASAALFLAILVVGAQASLGAYVMMVQSVIRMQNEVEIMLNHWRMLYQDALFAHNLFSFLDRPITDHHQPSDSLTNQPLTDRSSAESRENNRQHDQTNSFSKSEEYTEPIKPSAPPYPFPPAIETGIIFDDVWFRYPNSTEWVLQSISMHIRPGQTISLIGRNGAGKTTLIKLLLGLYKPTKGTIRIDGMPIDYIATNQLRQNMTAIFQDFTRFELTLREAIGFGDISKLDDAASIERAAKLAGIDQLAASLADGYDTLVNKNFAETEFSGGQWQKVALARSMMRDAQIWVLDEPTASLDPRAEVEVFDQFRQLTYGRTTLLISHRVGTARLADQIVVLKNGCIDAMGTHDELVQQENEYATLFHVQAQWYNDSETKGGSA